MWLGRNHANTSRHVDDAQILGVKTSPHRWHVCMTASGWMKCRVSRGELRWAGWSRVRGGPLIYWVDDLTDWLIVVRLRIDWTSVLSSVASRYCWPPTIDLLLHRCQTVRCCCLPCGIAGLLAVDWPRWLNYTHANHCNRRGVQQAHGAQMNDLYYSIRYKKLISRWDRRTLRANSNYRMNRAMVVFQQNEAPAHRSHHTVTQLRSNVHWTRKLAVEQSRSKFRGLLSVDSVVADGVTWQNFRHWSGKASSDRLLGSAKPGHTEPSDWSDAKNWRWLSRQRVIMLNFFYGVTICVRYRCCFTVFRLKIE